MMKKVTSRLLALSVCTALIASFGFLLLKLGNAQSERVVKITAHKFAYEPNEIHLKLGEPVILELTSKDVIHGFKIPDLGLRTDIEPGATVRLRLVPDKSGTFEFYCDNFCGVDHESMSAEIIVE